MFKPGAIKVETPTDTSRTFECGHHFELTSGTSRRRFDNSPVCPRCYAQRPTVVLKVGRLEEERGGSQIGTFIVYHWPSVWAKVSWTSCQGFDTPDDVVERTQKTCDAILEDLRLSVPFPGREGFLAEPDLEARFQEAIRRISLLVVHGRAEGRYIDRVGGKFHRCIRF